MIELNYTLIAVYCFIAALWFLFVMKSEVTKNYMLLVSWTAFLPFTFVLFVCGVFHCVFIEDFIKWCKKEF